MDCFYRLTAPLSKTTFTLIFIIEAHSLYFLMALPGVSKKFRFPGLQKRRRAN